MKADAMKEGGRKRAAAFPLVFLLVLSVLCLALPLFEAWLGHRATDISLAARLSPPGPGLWLGGDELGRDIFLRLLAGGRVSLLVAGAAALLSVTLGTLAGLVAGYFRGWVDVLLMRLCDVMLALPALPLLIVLAAVDPAKIGLPPDMAASPFFALAKIVVLLSLFGWVTVARLVRAQVLSLAGRDFIRAARALGQGAWAIVFRHLLPNVMPTVRTAAALSAAAMILAESVLSFLGLGIAPPYASWGNMLTRAESNLWLAPWLGVFPGMMIFLTVLACNSLAGRRL